MRFATGRGDRYNVTRIRAVLIGLAATSIAQLAPASCACADPIQATYSTTGTIGTTGIDGTPILSFQGVTNGSLTVGQPFSLGNFIVATPAGGGTTTYETPFQITLNVTASTGDPALPSATPVVLDGVISTESIGGKPTLEAMFGSVNILTVGAPASEAYTHFLSEGGSIAYGLYPTSTLVNLDATSQNGGIIGAPAELDSLLQTVPEPAPLVIAAFAGVMFFVRRRIARAYST